MCHCIALTWCLQASRGLRIQLMVEEETRFANFDVAEWHASAHLPSPAQLRKAIQGVTDDLAAFTQQLLELHAAGEHTRLNVEEIVGSQERIEKLQAQMDAPDFADGSRVFDGKVQSRYHLGLLAQLCLAGCASCDCSHG